MNPLHPYRLDYNDRTRICTIMFQDTPIIQGIIPQRHIAEQTIQIANDAFERAWKLQQEKIDGMNELMEAAKQTVKQSKSALEAIKIQNAELQQWNEQLMGDYWSGINGPKKKRKPRRLYTIGGKFVTKADFDRHIEEHGHDGSAMMKWSNEDEFPELIAELEGNEDTGSESTPQIE